MGYRHPRWVLVAAATFLLASATAAAQQDRQPGSPPAGSAMPGMEDCRSMHEMMGRLSTMMDEARAGTDAAGMGASMDRLQRQMAEMRAPMGRCMEMMAAMPDMGSMMGPQGRGGMGQGGMGEGGMGMMGACCPPGMGTHGATGIVALAIGVLIGLSLVAALVALTVFLWRHSRQPAAAASSTS